MKDFKFLPRGIYVNFDLKHFDLKIEPAEEECIQTNNHNSAIKISRDKECQSTDDAYLSAIMGD